MRADRSTLGRPPTALVLSGPFGMGHQMMAEASTAVLDRAGWTTRRRDSMDLLGPTAGRLGELAFHRILRVPGLYDALHFAHLRTGSPLARQLDALARRQMVPALRAELDAYPADLVLSVFATGAAAAAALKAERPGLHTAVLCTDVAVHRLWVHEGTDLFLVTSEAAEASVRRFRRDARVAVVPPPVRAAFYAAPSRSAARAALGLDERAPCVLTVDSGWGFGPIVAAAEQLAAAGVEVLAVAGRNVRLEQRLRALADSDSRVHPYGFTDRMPALMAAADVVVTLPGATTCNEARVLDRDLVLLDLMPGHGRDNLQHELARGRAQVADGTGAGIAGAVLRALDQPRRPATRRDPYEWARAFGAALGGMGLPVRPDGPTAAAEPAQPTAATTTTDKIVTRHAAEA